MDISVSQLNGRLASKLPPELPLGLVFVLGKVTTVDGSHFVLNDDGHELLCRTNDGSRIGVGDEVRASGHLMFDAAQLRYFLLARDIELVVAEPLVGNGLGSSRQLLAEGEGLLAALAAVKARAALAPEEPPEMPPWVKKLAPEEVRTTEVESDDAEVGDAPGQVALDEGLVTMLSAAMDSEEELELTPEMLAPYRDAMPETVEEGVNNDTQAGQMDTAVPTNPTSYQPTNREDTDWLVLLLIISFFVFTIAIVVTIVLLIL